MEVTAGQVAGDGGAELHAHGLAAIIAAALVTLCALLSALLAALRALLRPPPERCASPYGSSAVCFSSPPARRAMPARDATLRHREPFEHDASGGSYDPCEYAASDGGDSYASSPPRSSSRRSAGAAATPGSKGSRNRLSVFFPRHRLSCLAMDMVEGASAHAQQPMPPPLPLPPSPWPGSCGSSGGSRRRSTRKSMRRSIVAPGLGTASPPFGADGSSGGGGGGGGAGEAADPLGRKWTMEAVHHEYPHEVELRFARKSQRNTPGSGGGGGGGGAAAARRKETRKASHVSDLGTAQVWLSGVSVDGC
ncbi:hypothetical protein JKP88DRAFT_350644 [Tribonema minus]|uniref:Uncharacterized protein n=1 Tax=Tribonema minus TaxID=303371 RepID=A0A835YLP2_9STRA|nr:hypothetical protein JKP88DRAFT_350644 [Tribonema minus]